MTAPEKVEKKTSETEQMAHCKKRKIMAGTRTFEDVRTVILLAHKTTGAQDKVGFYNTWAESYEQDVALLDYQAPLLAAKCITSFFSADKEKAVILDVACGTGLVSAHLRKMGFQQFVGVDGSEGMLHLARKTGLYQELKECMLGQDCLPVQDEFFDIVVIVGALSFGQVPVPVIEELWRAAKPGGYVCMTTRGNTDNQKYKAELEYVMTKMEEEQKWKCVSITEVKEWEKSVVEHECGYIPGIVYLYQRS